MPNKQGTKPSIGSKQVIGSADDVKINPEYDKPIQLVAGDINDKIITIVNDAMMNGIPALVIAPIIQNVLQQVNSAQGVEYQNALQVYQQSNTNKD